MENYNSIEFGNMKSKEEKEQLLASKQPRKKTKVLLNILIVCLTIVAIVSASLAFYFIYTRKVTTSEYARINDVVINKLQVNKDGSGTVQLYNTRKEVIDVTGYYISQVPRNVNGKQKIYFEATKIKPQSKVEINIEKDFFNIKSAMVTLHDPSGRKYMDLISYDESDFTNKESVLLTRYPDGGEWSTEGKLLKTKTKNDKRNIAKRAQDFEIHIFDVGQGDSQLIIFPSGYTIFIDVNEDNWNSKKGATAVAAKLLDILGGKKIDVGVVSHLHLDHLGYANYGGLWSLIEEHNFEFGKVIGRDAGKWVDYNSDGVCDHNTEIEWHYAGTYSGTASRWLCYATDPSSKLYKVREIAQLCSTTQINPPDAYATVTIITTDGIGASQLNGDPVTGDYTSAKVPPSENDYSIGLLVRYKNIAYATMGDLDGEYASSSFGYTYNHVEKVVAPRVGGVDIYRANHHGSSHSSSTELLSVLQPTVTVFSCGNGNSYGHPAQTTLDRVKAVNSDMFLTTNCAQDRSYGTNAYVNMGDIKISSSDGDSYTISGLTGTKTYQARSDKAAGNCA